MLVMPAPLVATHIKVATRCPHEAELAPKHPNHSDDFFCPRRESNPGLPRARLVQ